MSYTSTRRPISVSRPRPRCDLRQPPTLSFNRKPMPLTLVHRPTIACVALLSLPLGGCADDDEVSDIVVRAIDVRNALPIPGAQIRIGNEPWKTSDDNGEVMFRAKQGPVDVSVRYTYRDRADSIDLFRMTAGPEIIVDTGAGQSDWRFGFVEGTAAPLRGPPDAMVTFAAGLGGREGRQRQWTASAVGTAAGTVDWLRELAFSMPVRAWETDARFPPTEYYGFGATTASFLFGDTAYVPVTVALEPVTSGPVEGVVTAPVGTVDDLYADLWLRFGRYESHRLVPLYPIEAGPLSIVAPIVPGAEAWVGVQYLGLAWHRRRVTAPVDGLSFDIPDAPILIEPAEAAPLTTSFRWEPREAGGTSTLTVQCMDEGAVMFAIYSIETVAPQATLPAEPQLSIDPSWRCSWFVKWCDDASAQDRCAFSRPRSLTP